MFLAFSHELARRAQQQRSLAIGTILACMGVALFEEVRRVVVMWRRARHARATYEALSRLDDWTLRDLGMDRSELESVAREASAQVDYRRMRARN